MYEEDPIEVDETTSILVVDNQRENLLAISAVLESLGQRVVTAASGPEALRHLLEEDFCCILLDVQMPEMDGFETAALIRERERCRHVPIIFLTAIHRGEDHVAKGYQLGAVDYLFKPIVPEVLRTKVMVFVDIQRKTQALERRAQELAEAKDRMHARMLVEMEEQGRRAREMIQHKNTFVADRSHELRTPLNAILGFAELMYDIDEDLDHATIRSYLGHILNGARHLLKLVDDILDLLKVESGRITFQPEWMDIRGVVSEVIELLATIAGKKRITLEAEVDPGIGQVFLDPGKVRQVLYNFISNSLKFTPDGGTVRVQVLPQGADWVMLEVTDTGIGIRSEDLGRLFREFEQIHATRSSRGSGLGLALTRKLVEAQGGFVGVDSEPGKGSRFYAVLPRQAGPPSEGTEIPETARQEEADRPPPVTASLDEHRERRRLQAASATDVAEPASTA